MSEQTKLAPKGATLTTHDSSLARAREVAHRWELTGYGRARLTEGPDRWLLELATGGWSENEEQAHELQRGYETGDLFWMLFWESSHRGGRHVLQRGHTMAGEEPSNG